MLRAEGAVRAKAQRWKESREGEISAPIFVCVCPLVVKDDIATCSIRHDK